MKKYPSGSVELYEMIDEAKVFLNYCLKRDNQYVDADAMSYEEIICRLFIECDDLLSRNDELKRQIEYAEENITRAENAVKTIDEAFLIAKAKIMEYYFSEVTGTLEQKGTEVDRYSRDYVAGYATAIGDFNKFLR